MFEAELPGRRMIPEEIRMIYTRYASTLEYIQDKNVLEVGCGAGLGLGLMGKYAKTVIAGDYAIENVTIAKNHYQDRFKIIKLDAHNLEFKEKFDVIVTMETLQYFDIPQFLDECRKVLTKDGIILACLPNPEQNGFFASKMSKNYFTKKELAVMFLNQGFQCVFFGAFEIHDLKKNQPWNKSKKNQCIALIGKILRAIPGGKIFKTFIGQKVFHKMVLTNEFKEKDFLTEPLQQFPHNNYKTIYLIARVQKNS